MRGIRNESMKKNQKDLSSAAMLIVMVGMFAACGDRVSSWISLPVGVSVVVPAADLNTLQQIEAEFPHETLTISVSGRPMELTEDFQLVQADDAEGKSVTARYHSSDLVAAVEETHCRGAIMALATPVRAVFCGGGFAEGKTRLFSLITADGVTRTATSLVVEQLDRDNGVRHLSLSF